MNITQAIFTESGQSSVDVLHELKPAMANAPFIINADFNQANSGDVHNEKIGKEEANATRHVWGDKRVGVKPTNDRTIFFNTDHFAFDLAFNKEEFERLLKLIAQEQTFQKGMVPQGIVNNIAQLSKTFDDKYKRRIQKIFEDFEKWVFNGNSGSRIVGLRQLLSKLIPDQNVIAANGGHGQAGQSDSYSVFICNMDEFCSVLYPGTMNGAIEVGGYEDITSVSTASNGNVERESVVWKRINAGFGIKAIQNLYNTSYGVARLANLKLKQKTGSDDGTIYSSNVRSQLNVLARSVQRSNSSGFTHCFVADVLFEEIKSVYGDPSIAGGIQYFPKVIAEAIDEKSYNQKDTMYGIDTYCKIDNNIIVHSTSGLSVPEVSIG